MAPSPTQLTDPIVPNLGFTATPTTSPPPQHSRLLPSQPAPPQSRHHATLCGHASHPVAPTLTRIAGTHWPCHPPTKMCFLYFFPFIKLFQDNAITSMSPPSPSCGHRPLLHHCNRADLPPQLLPPNDQRQTPLRLSLPPRPCCIPTLSPLHATSHTRTAATLQHLGPHPSCINSSCM